MPAPSVIITLALKKKQINKENKSTSPLSKIMATIAKSRMKNQDQGL